MIDILLDYIYPRNIKCIVCKCPIHKDNTYSLCKMCFEKINFIQDGCDKCSKPLTLFYKQKLCPMCIDKDYFFDRAFSCTEYDENIHKIIYSLKYGGKTFLAYPIAQVMKDKIDYENISFDYITYVPLHRKREKVRGFNQSFLIANNLGKFLNKEVISTVQRNKETRYLSKLTKKQRELELKDSFTITKEKNKIISKDILIIDDIFTTGSTTNEMSKVLKENGAGKIYVLAFATGRNIY
ncbi:competence protein ComFC [Alkalithermobacter thermoalcaliphilus JW-YL-7 = DSM 7308]|uniref:Competence protein ComFC n=1 Tax=Alkalithermobacter thermoalcaliphilus JW-YL-7 = DSM 7308 TaxID=1121328 RepID=A0A150FPF3_CLOPD|nr:phosphoribosyltransferase [[Clostridium] paradoxum JW-YL-7 = DSM 7308]SHL05634.1 competence protein ComFC [[Clostridium] paradoxum JW-YL-7 = DSM 7308]